MLKRQYITATLPILVLLSISMLFCLLPPADGAIEKNILILHGGNLDYPAHDRFNSGFKKRLERDPRYRFNYSYEYPDLRRFSRYAGYLDATARYYEAKYSLLQPDLIVTGNTTGLFLMQFGASMFPSAPIVLIWDEDAGPVQELPANYVLLHERTDFRRQIQLILRTRPFTRKIYVVIGDSEFERRIAERFRLDTNEYTSGVEIVLLNKLPYERILKELKAIDGNSAVLFLFLFSDVSGKNFISVDALKDIYNNTQAPIYGISDHLVGDGIVGGYVYSSEARGRYVAETALDIITAGKLYNKSSNRTIQTGTYTFDWREVKRWKIDENELPSGSKIEFIERSFWDFYRKYIISGIVLLLLQTSLIVALLVNRIRRKRAEELVLRVNAELEGKVIERTAELAHSNATLTAEIVEREKAQEALRESEAYLQLQFDRLPLGCIVWGKDFRVQSWNPESEKIFGYSAREAVGRASAELMMPMEVQAEADLIWRQLVSGETVDTIEIENRTKDGRKIVCEWTNTPFTDNQGQVRGVISMVQDITSRKAAHEERLRLERQLQEARKAESLGRMAGAVAHHFNNLLGAVMGNLELAMCGLQPRTEFTRYLSNAMSASGRAADISRLMLASLGQIPFVRRSVGLSEVCCEAVPSLVESLPQKIRLRTGFPGKGPVILADPLQIKQVLTNLVVNAGEAVGDREGEITIAVSVVGADVTRRSGIHPPDWQPVADFYACLTVSDTGCGMDPDTMEKLFDPFFSTKFAGRGLGLAVVLGALKTHDGAVTVESTPGRGTVFRVFFPLAERGPSAEENAAEFASAGKKDSENHP